MVVIQHLYNAVFYLMQNPIVLVLWNAEELTIIDRCMHYSIVVQFLLCRCNPKTTKTTINKHVSLALQTNYERPKTVGKSHNSYALFLQIN